MLDSLDLASDLFPVTCCLILACKASFGYDILQGMLRAMCLSLDLPFQETMLEWNPGPKPFDGVWADWWYSSSHRCGR